MENEFIQKMRTEYPEYDDLDDGTLVGLYHQAFYSDMPLEQFKTRIGLGPTPEEQRIESRQLAETGGVPEGAAIHYGDNVTEYPNTGIRYNRPVSDTSTPENEQQLHVANEAGRRRNYSAENPIAGIYDPLNNPYAIGYMSGFTWGGADEALKHPVPREIIRQSYEQGQQDRPYGMLAAEVAGGIGSALSVGKALSGTRVGGAVDRAVSSGSRLSRFLKGAALGGGLASGEAALTARPGQRLDAATDPATVALGAGIGGAFNSMLPAYGASGATPAAADAATSATDVATEDVLRAGQRLYGTDAPPIPRGIVTGDPRFGNYPNVPLTGSASHSQLVDETKAFLDQTAKEQVDQLGTVAESTGAASSALASSMQDSLAKRITKLRNDYDNFKVNEIDPVAPVAIDPDTRAMVGSIFERRMAAGSKPEDASLFREAADLLGRDTATFQGLQDARSEIINMLSNTKRYAISSPKRRDLEQVKDALTQAMEDTIAATYKGDLDEVDNAVMAFRQLDKEYAIANDEMRTMSKYLKGADTAALNAVNKAFKDGGDKAISRLKQMRDAAGSEWGNVMALTVDRIGRGSDGIFDPGRFVKNWDKLAPDAKKAMFDAEHLQALDDISTISSRVANVRPRTASDNIQAGVRAMLTFAIPGTHLDTLAGAIVQAQRLITGRTLASPFGAKKVAKFLEEMDEASKAPAPARQSLLGERAYNGLRKALGVGIGPNLYDAQNVSSED